MVMSVPVDEGHGLIVCFDLPKSKFGKFCIFITFW